MALASMLALPLLSRVLPAWRVVPVPVPLRPVASFVAAPVATAPPVVSALRESGVESTADAPSSSAAPLNPSSVDGAAAKPGASAAAPAAPEFDWKTALMAVWIVGGAMLVLRLGYGMVRVFWMERRAVEITDDDWVRIADRLARRLRVGRMVTLLREAHAVVPMTWGVVRPVVLLPADAEEWDTERRTVVLAHELAHVRRWDTLTQWIAHLALALFWFNPLVWMAARQMREEREHACDDAVLSIGTRPVEYADHLLDIVRSLGSTEGPAAALAMARRSQFEGRLLAILDSATPRGGVSRGLGFAALALAAAAVLPLGALRAALPVQGAGPAAAAFHPAASPRAATSPQTPVEKLSKGTFAGIAAKVGAIVDRAVDALPRRDTATTPIVSAPALPAAPASAASAAGAASSQSGGTAPAPPVAPVSPPPAPSASGVSAIASALGTSQDRVAAMLQDSGGYADVIRAAAGIGASAEKASVLLAVLRQPDLSATDLTALLRVAGGISADPERRDVLREAARRYPLAPPAVRRAFFGAVAAFAACPERRDVLLAVLARNADAEVVSSVVLSARAMATEAERRDVLLKVVEKTGSPELLAQVVAAARELTSSAGRRDVLVKVLGRPGLPSSVLRAAFGAAAEITASAEKRDVLRYGAENQRLDVAAREAYLSAANTISASAERAEAISALLGERNSTAAAPKPTAPAGVRATYDLVADDGTWNSDLYITQDGGRVIRLRTVNVVRGAAADDIRSIRRGGSLMVEETRGGRTRRVDMVPGAGGAIVRTFKVDGQPRPFDAEAERWLSSILREFTATTR
ncbi:MAG: M56 family metallopeptidase [Longimicrobiaceae bacterium]